MGGAFHGVVRFGFHSVQPCADRYLVHLRHSGSSRQRPVPRSCRSTSITVTRSTAPSGRKKNGVFYMLNSIAFLILAFTPVTSLIYRIIFGIAIVGDLSLFCTAQSGSCTMAPAPVGAMRTKRTTSTDPSASCRSFAVHSIWSTFSAQGGAAALYFDGGGTRVQCCSADLTSVL